MIDLKLQGKTFYLTDTRLLLALRAGLVGFFGFNFGLSDTKLLPFFCAFNLEIFLIFSVFCRFFSFSADKLLEGLFLVDFLDRVALWFFLLVIQPFFEASEFFLDSESRGFEFFLPFII